jgi:hypothetical protein
VVFVLERKKEARLDANREFGWKLPKFVHFTADISMLA